MATDTVLSENTQQFNDDEIVDNFSAGPDDGVPMGLGGEAGKQSSPASSTLEADMIAAPEKPAKTTKQEEKPPSGDALPPDDDAASGEPEPVQDAASDEGKGEPEPQPTEPEPPIEFPTALLRMAGFSTAEDAKGAGFNDPEALLAAVQLMGKTFSKPVKVSRDSYLGAQTPESQPTQIPAEAPPTGDDLAYKPFKPDNPELFDEELLKLIDAQNAHHAAQYEQLAARVKDREARNQWEEGVQRVNSFERVVQGLGKDWESVFGKGDIDDLATRTDVESQRATQNRLELFKDVERVRRLNAEQGGKPMSLEDEVQWATMLRYPDKFKQQLRRTSEAKAQARRGVQASRPTARKTPLGTRDERTLARLQAKYPNAGFNQSDDEIGGEI